MSMKKSLNVEWDEETNQLQVSCSILAFPAELLKWLCWLFLNRATVRRHIAASKHCHGTAQGFLEFQVEARNFVQEEVTYPSTINASGLKIISRRVDSDSESTSKTKKTEIVFSKKMQWFEIWERNSLKFS